MTRPLCIGTNIGATSPSEIFSSSVPSPIIEISNAIGAADAPRYVQPTGCGCGAPSLASSATGLGPASCVGAREASLPPSATLSATVAPPEQATAATQAAAEETRRTRCGRTGRAMQLEGHARCAANAERSRARRIAR
jgi:hypothetical protein